MMMAPNNGRQKTRKIFMSLDHGPDGAFERAAVGWAHTPKLMKIQCPAASGQSAKSLMFGLVLGIIRRFRLIE
jgi:hypothetical protein